MTQGFDKHWKEWCIASNCTEDEALTHFEAGAASRQAEIDELQKRIDDAIVQINIYYDSDGMEDICLSDIVEILKGESNE